MPANNMSDNSQNMADQAAASADSAIKSTQRIGAKDHKKSCCRTTYAVSAAACWVS